VAPTASLAELVVPDVCFQDLAHLLTLMLVALAEKLNHVGSILDILVLIPPILLVLDLLCPL